MVISAIKKEEKPVPVVVEMPPKTKRELQAQARRRGLSMSAYVRYLVNRVQEMEDGIHSEI